MFHINKNVKKNKNWTPFEPTLAKNTPNLPSKDSD